MTVAGQLDQEIASRQALERDLAKTRADAESAERRSSDEIRQLQLERDALLKSIDTVQEQVQRLNHANREARENLERARIGNEAHILQLTAEHTQIQRAVEQARADLESKFERARTEHASRRIELEHDIKQLQAVLQARGRELDAVRSELDAVRTDANRVPQLQSNLDHSRAELLRRFQQSPYGICRCHRDGTLGDVNDALVSLLGYRSTDALRKVSFSAIFESPDDLRLLIEGCLARGERQSIETTLAKRDKDRVVVRLAAAPAGPESIEIVVEDLTNLRVIEAQLRRAHRMEAVGRLAVEVAGTCDNLLRDVSQEAAQWLATIESDKAFRHRGESLLQDLERAAGFLRQLSGYATNQASSTEPIDVNGVLRRMEPVLKRIAGDNIELVLPKTSSPVRVDVEAERVERVLVNVASYGRERMRFGGRLTFELASVVVGRQFVTDHPNVRSGNHVLMTVKEVRGDEHTGAQALPPAADIRPGVDLGVLQGLIRDCGGHLWMKAEPTGEMVLKVRLPQYELDRRAKLFGTRTPRGRSLGDWLRH
jgi:PAS domain S-box-containing protein